MPSARPISVFLVEDDADLRAALERTLHRPAEGLHVVGAARSAKEAEALLAQASPFDVALVDLGLPDEPGTVVLAALRRLHPEAVPIAFTVFEDAATIVAALRAGARGYVLKSTPLRRLVDVLREAQAGGAPMTPSVARIVVDALAGSPSGPASARAGADPLTERERDVLAILSRGHTYLDVASALGISLGTVQTHVKSIYAKLEVASKAEATLEAVRRGLL